MKLTSVRDWLLPSAAERDEGFRQEILSLSDRGLKIVAAVEAAAAIAALPGLMSWMECAGLLTLAVAAILAGRLHVFYNHERLIALIASGLGVTIAGRSMAAGSSGDFPMGAVTVLILATVAAVPLLPAQSLGLGLVAFAAGFTSHHRVFLCMLAGAAAAVSATLYAQRRANYTSYVTVLQATQDFRTLQERVLAAESSATMVRLSAALAHELSQPVGTVSSALDTLLLLGSRLASTPLEEQQRLITLQEDLGRSLKESMARLRKMVNRIQQLTNLDEAGSRPANVNELIRESICLIEPQSRERVRFQLHLRPLPDLACRPQQLIAVFCNVLTNSIAAVTEQGEISISTSASGGRLEVTIEDNGRGIEPAQLANIFDPAFEISQGRVSTGNWSLFTSRQFIKDHGGDMRIHSRLGEGTTVTLTLPCSS